MYKKIISLLFLVSLPLATTLADDFSTTKDADMAMGGPLDAGTYDCKDERGRDAGDLVVHDGGLTFTFGHPPADYTQNDSVNGGNAGEIGFKGTNGRTCFVTTGPGGKPPYKLRFPTADEGGNVTYECTKPKKKGK